MDEYTLVVELISNCLLGSGEGWGSVIDNDIVFDRIGLPYFPARRLKGCLRESAEEILEMLESAQLKKYDNNIIKVAFGTSADTEGAKIIFNSLHLPNHQEVASWCRWGIQEFSEFISPEILVNSFTSIKQQTAINEQGVADDGSLRTFRVLKKGITFEGKVIMKEENSEVMNLLALSCANLRHVGTMRNRGYGKVKCCLKRGKIDLSEKCIIKLEEGVI